MSDGEQMDSTHGWNTDNINMFVQNGKITPKVNTILHNPAWRYQIKMVPSDTFIVTFDNIC